VGNEPSEGEGIMDKQEERETGLRREGTNVPRHPILLSEARGFLFLRALRHGPRDDVAATSSPADAVSARDQRGRCVSFPVSNGGSNLFT
jgi:hypothetical protein